MIESIYKFHLLFKYKLFDIVDLQTDNILILANHNFIAIQEKAIKMAKFITKKQAYLLPKIFIKFNNI